MKVAAEKGVPRSERDAEPKCDALGVIRSAVPGSDLHFRPKPALKAAGLYRIRVSVWSFMWDRGEVLLSDEPLPVKWFVGETPVGYVDAPSLEPTVHELVSWVEPGEEISFNPASIPLRPPVTNEAQRDKLVETRVKSGHSFQEALLTGNKATLCSPDFLFLQSPTQAATEIRPRK